MTTQGWRENLARMRTCLCQGARLMVGVPDYEGYVAHMRSRHPDREPMPYAEFFRERQLARYGSNARGGFRCC